MRLTLRTLLAYMDDRLKPAQAKEIGDKIQQSEFASELVNRIGSVIRQRRLASPTAQGNVSHIDPNLLAEYLDDQLTPDIVEAIERRILTSDVCLAEIAAAHQILAEIGDAVPVGDAFRDRLYAVGESAVAPETLENGVSEQPAAAGKAAPEVAPANNENAGKAAAPAKPDTTMAPDGKESTTTAESPIPWTAPQSQSSWKRWFPAIVVVVAGLAWVGLVVNDNPFSDSSAGSGATDDDAVAAAEETDAGDGKVADGVPDDSASEVAGAASTAVADTGAVDAVPVTPAAGDATAEPTIDAAASTPQVNPAPEEAGVENPAVATTDTQPDPESAKPETDVGVPDPNMPVADAEKPVPAVIPSAPAPVSVTLLDGDGILLVKRNQADWKLSTEFGADLQLPDVELASRQLTLMDGDIFGVPEPFALSVTIGESGWQGLVLGNSLVGVLAADGDLPAGLKLQQGRIRFSGDPTAVRDEDSAVILRVGAVDHSWLIQPATEDTVFGFEVRRPLSAGVGESPPTEGGMLAVYVASGQIKIMDAAADADADAEPLVLVQGQSRAIGTGSPASAAIPVSATYAIEVLPDWIYADAVLPDPSSAPAQQFLRILEDDRTLVMGLLANISDRNPQVARYCGQSIALMEDPVLLVECLLESDHEEVRRAAIESVRAWLAEDATRAEKLDELLRNRLPSAEVPSIVRLLQGFPRSAASSKDVSSQLVAAMEASRLLVREIAFYYVEGMTGQRRGYSANDDSLSRRRRSMQQWKRHTEQLGGRLAPATTPDEPAPEDATPGTDDAAPDGTPEGSPPGASE